MEEKQGQPRDMHEKEKGQHKQKGIRNSSGAMWLCDMFYHLSWFVSYVRYVL